MKYCWRSGNTTYFDNRHFEDTFIFDSRIKPNIVKVEAAIAVNAHFSLQLKVFGERRFGAIWSMTNLNMNFHDSQYSTFEVKPPTVLSIPMNFTQKNNKQNSPNIGERSAKCTTAT